MARLGLADDIVPWSADTFGEMPQVADTAGLGASRFGGGEDFAPATATVSADPMAAGPMAAGPRQAPRDAERQRRQAAIDKALPSWDESPMERLALVVQAGLAGFAGQKPAYLTMIEQAEKRETQHLQRALVGIQISEHAKKAVKGMAPEKRREFLDSYAKQFEMLGPDFTKQIKALDADGGANSEAVARMFGSRGKKILALTGNDPEQALELLKNPELGKQLDAADDQENLPVIASKLSTIFEAASAVGAKDPGFLKLMEKYRDSQGSTMLPLALVRQINSTLSTAQGKLNESELATLSRNPKELYALGIMPPDVEVDLEKSKLTQHSDIFKMGQDLKTARSQGDYKTAAALEAALAKRSEESRGEIGSFVNPETGKLVYADKKSDAARKLLAQGYELHNDYEHKPREFQDIETNEVVVAMPSTLRKLGVIGQFREFDRRGATSTEVRQGDSVYKQEQGGGPPASGYRVLDFSRAAAGQPGVVIRTGEKAPPPETPAAPAPGAEAATPPGTSAAAGVTAPAAAEATPSDLAKNAAGPAAPLLAPPAANERLDSFSRRVASPATKTKETPEREVDRATRDAFTHGRIGLENYKIMRELTHLIGDPVKGASAIVKGVFNPWGVLGDTTDHARLRSAITSQESEVQAVIDGVPTNKDQVIFARALVPSRMAPKETWKATLDHSENVYKTVISDLIAYHKGRGSSMPKDLSESVKQFGIDADKVHKWDGKGNAMAKSIAAAVGGMGKKEVQDLVDDIAKNRSAYSKEAIDAVIARGEKLGLK